MTPTILDTKDVWDKTLAIVELSVSPANFNTWFKNTYICKHESDIIHVAVPNAFVRDWLSGKYAKLLLKTLRDQNPSVRGLEIVIQKEEDRARREAVIRPSFSPQMEMTDIYVNREDNLNPKYTFDGFVVGPFNELAHAASQAVIKNPGKSYNPLFIYGGTGLGKTHLIQSIGNSYKKDNTSKKVFYVSLEKFSSDYVEAVRANKINAFKDKYRKYDLLIMDDIQFISTKEGTQDELFHLFNYLYENHKQIVFSSDKPPKHIVGLEERLRSRFEGGMQADVVKPEYESRVAILRAKAKTMPFPPSDDSIEYVASVILDSIRELEGTLNMLACQAQLKLRPLSVSEIKSLVKNNIKQQKTVSIKDVISTVAAFYNIEEQMLYEKTRRKEVVKPRQVAMFILREDFSTSYPYIGQKLGGRDHTTVIHAYEKIKEDLKVDNLLSQEIEQIKIRLFSESPSG